MDIINLELTEGTELDFQIALVENPAIESDFMAFSKKELFKVTDEEKRIVSGFAMVSELPIYRRDENGKEYYVKFSAKSIKNISEQFFKNGLNNQTNLNHQTDNFIQDVFVFESFLIDEDRGILSPKGYDKQPDGSWFISMKVNNDKVWESIKNGEFKGFSVEGVFDKEENKFLATLKNIVDNYKKEV